MTSEKPIKLIEIARSFSYKLNCGNYESRDFFCSQKAECEEKDAEKVSKALAQFCKEQVIKEVNEYINEKNEPMTIEEKTYLKNQEPNIKNQSQNRYNPKNQDYIASDGDREDLEGNRIK